MTERTLGGGTARTQERTLSSQPQQLSSAVKVVQQTTRADAGVRAVPQVPWERTLCRTSFPGSSRPQEVSGCTKRVVVPVPAEVHSEARPGSTSRDPGGGPSSPRVGAACPRPPQQRLANVAA